MIETPLREPVINVTSADEQALFEEARRLRRRRWMTRGVVLVGLIAVTTAIAALMAARGHARASGGNAAAGLLPNGSLSRLQVAGALAVGPTGALYVADTARHRVLVRLPDGEFRVVAGDGSGGFSGDGRSALHAELSTVSGLAFSPTGSLYMVDGGRVREVRPDGVISTVAGDGDPARRISQATPARSTGLGTAAQNAGPSIAFAPDGTLYITTMWQLLRLTTRDELQPVDAVVQDGPFRGALANLGHVAVDGRGDIDVSGVNGYSVWQIPPGGQPHEVGPGSGARESGGDYSVLQRAPDGDVYAEDGPHILRVTPQHLIPTLRIVRVHGEYFWPTYFAFGPLHETYLDELPGDSGFEAHQQLIADRNGHITLLWQELNHGHRDSLRRAGFRGDVVSRFPALFLGQSVSLDLDSGDEPGGLVVSWAW